jgi:hypothetical protein
MVCDGVCDDVCDGVCDCVCVCVCDDVCVMGSVMVCMCVCACNFGSEWKKSARAILAVDSLNVCARVSRIPLFAYNGPYMDLVVREVDFGFVNGGQSAEFPLRVTNIGSVAVNCDATAHSTADGKTDLPIHMERRARGKQLPPTDEESETHAGEEGNAEGDSPFAVYPPRRVIFPQETQEFQLEFHPGTVSGLQTATLFLTCRDGETHMVRMRGWAGSPIKFLDDTLDFGFCQSTALVYTKKLRVTNCNTLSSTPIRMKCLRYARRSVAMCV